VSILDKLAEQKFDAVHRMTVFRVVRHYKNTTKEKNLEQFDIACFKLPSKKAGRTEKTH